MHTLPAMAVKKRYTFFITEELDRGLKALKQRDGMPEAEALRRALTAFLVAKAVLASPHDAPPAPARLRPAASRRRGLPPKA
jgi:hypothetical protein